MRLGLELTAHLWVQRGKRKEMLGVGSAHQNHPHDHEKVYGLIWHEEGAPAGWIQVRQYEGLPLGKRNRKLSIRNWAQIERIKWVQTSKDKHETLLFY